MEPTERLQQLEKLPSDATMRHMAESNDRVSTAVERNTVTMQAFPGQLVAATKEIRKEVDMLARDVTLYASVGASSVTTLVFLFWLLVKLLMLYLAKKKFLP